MSQVATLPRRSLVDSMASRYDMEPKAFVDAIKATVVKGNVSNEQFAAFLMVAKEYDLNPLLKEIFAFPSNGGIQPIVSIDGWMKLINSHAQFDGMEFTDMPGEDGKLSAVECRMYRKDRARPICVIEYMSECYRQTPTWKQWPARMLRHKAAIQAARYAFGFSNIMEPDEFERMRDVSSQKAGAVVLDPLSDDPAPRRQVASELVTEDGEIIGAELGGREEPTQDDAAVGEPEAAAEGEIDPDTPAAELDEPQFDETQRDRLTRYCRDVLTQATGEGDAGLLRDRIGKTHTRWKADMGSWSTEEKAVAERAFKAAQAVARGDTDLSSAVTFVSGEIGVDEAAVTPGAE